MAISRDAEIGERLVRVEETQKYIRDDVAQIKGIVQNLNEYKQSIERRRAFQKGVLAAGTVAGGGVGAKIASLLGWLS
jgi:hypothetical protein